MQTLLALAWVIRQNLPGWICAESMYYLKYSCDRWERVSDCDPGCSLMHQGIDFWVTVTGWVCREPLLWDICACGAWLGCVVDSWSFLESPSRLCSSLRVSYSPPPSLIFHTLASSSLLLVDLASLANRSCSPTGPPWTMPLHGVQFSGPGVALHRRWSKIGRLIPRKACL